MLNDKITIDFIDIYQGTWRSMDQGIKKNTLIKIEKSQIIRWSTHMCAPGYDFEIRGDESQQLSIN